MKAKGWLPRSAKIAAMIVSPMIALAIGGNRISDVLMWHAALGVLLLAAVIDSEWPRDSSGRYASMDDAKRFAPPHGHEIGNKLRRLYGISVFLSLPTGLILKFFTNL